MAELQRRAAANQANRPKVTASHAALLGKSADELRRELGATDAPVEKPVEKTALEPNERVHVRTLRTDGIVVEDYGDTVLIAIGPMKTVVQKSDVEKRATAPPKKRPASAATGGGAKVDAAARTVGELDVRGKRFVEAEPLVERWIDDAALAGNSPLRLIHGKGTGMLGRGLQEYLRTHPAVKSVRYGREDEGSGGVTIIELA
jgi:DNA mismatch repair protein MutS2